MQVRVLPHPTKPNGLAVAFPWSQNGVDNVKLCLGFEFDRATKLWMSEGPEVLLDMERFGIEVEWISASARVTAEEFRQQLWNIIDARAEPITDEEYGYQLQGSKVLASSTRYILGDDMGVGKSKQALDAAAMIGIENPRILITSPKTPTHSWLNEVRKWHPEWQAGVVPDQRIGYKKGNDIGRDAFWKNPPQIVIANHDKLKTVDWPMDIEWDVFIMDEASNFKNSATLLYKIVKRVIKNSTYVWALTGTPLEKKLPELYNLFKLLRPSVLGGYMRFRDHHILLSWTGDIKGSQNLDLLRDRIGYFQLRRTKAEVQKNLPAKLPPQPRFIQFSTLEEKEYQEMLMEFDKFAKDKQISESADAFTKTIRMRQFCCSPSLLGIGRKGSKYEELLDIVDEWEGRLLIFCFFEEMTALLKQWLQEDRPDRFNPQAYISGKVKSEDRFNRCELFNEGKLGDIFVSTDAGQQGITLTGADLVVHYDQIWNAQKMNQRTDRAHRIGQKKVVNVVHLLCLDSIDVGMYEWNKEEEQLFKEVIDGAEEAFLRKLDAPRLRRIVHGNLSKEYPVPALSQTFA